VLSLPLSSASLQPKDASKFGVSKEHKIRILR
jgi:hypothetical protein